MKTTRVQLELPEPSMERLKALKDKTEAASYAEVIKNSLRFDEDCRGRKRKREEPRRH
jgi:Arc/MetJ-type ribon-helix-helix transcriptional regulator